MDEARTPESADPQQQPSAAPPVPEQAPATPAPAAAAPEPTRAEVAAFTQARQKLAAVATALGIPKESTPEQFVAAITERRTALVTEDAELAADPRVAAAIARARRIEEQSVQERYPEASVIVAAVMDAAKGTGSLTDLAEIVNTALVEQAIRMNGAAPAPAGQAQPTPPAQPAQPPAQPADQRFIGDLTSDLRGGAGMYQPGITREQAGGTMEGYFGRLASKVRGL